MTIIARVRTVPLRRSSGRWTLPRSFYTTMARSDGSIKVDTSKSGPRNVATITIARASKSNCLNSRMLELLATSIKETPQRTNDVSCIVLTGEGDRAFVAGADINEMSDISSPAFARSFITKIHEVCNAIRICPVPVLGRINGVAFGAGLEIAACCDILIASSKASFSMPEVRLGLPSVVEAAILPQLIGWGRTRYLLLTGTTIPATTAQQWGLVAEVVEHENLDQKVSEIAKSISICGPKAVQSQKRLMRRWEEVSLNVAIEDGIDCFGRAFETDAGTSPEPLIMSKDYLEMRKRSKL